MRRRTYRCIAAVAALGAAASLFAAGPYEGEVRRIDRSAAKITIRHGPLAELDMPAMTMVFQVKDKALLDAASPGDKIKVDAEKLGGAYVVTRIEPSR